MIIILVNLQTPKLLLLLFQPFVGRGFEPLPVTRPPTQPISKTDEEEKATKRAKKEVAEPQVEVTALGGGGASVKPIKWKKIIAKELKSCGGRMTLKELRKAAVAEARAHPSHVGRKSEELKLEFDAQLPSFHKFEVAEGQVRLAKTKGGDDD